MLSYCRIDTCQSVKHNVFLEFNLNKSGIPKCSKNTYFDFYKTSSPCIDQCEMVSNVVLLKTLSNVSGLICVAVVKHQWPKAESVIMIVRGCMVGTAD